MTTIILLVRHAEHIEHGHALSGRRPGVSLSKHGERQARAVADRLRAEPIGAVYSSPRERAWSTARTIAELHGMDAILEPGLDEIDFGAWEGRSFAELEQAGGPAWRQWNVSRATARTPGGESMVEAVARAEVAIELMSRRHPEDTVAAISHCDIIRGVIAHHLRMSLDNLQRFDIDPASISRLGLGPDGGHVVSVNERAVS